MKRALAILAALVLVAAHVRAAGDEVHVRIVQIKGSGRRGADPFRLDKDLEPLRAHLDRQKELGHARYELIATRVQAGKKGEAIAFALANDFEATVTATQDDGKHKVVLVLVKKDKKGGKDEKVVDATLSMKDGATAIQTIGGALPGDADLLLALTVSRESF